MIQSHILPALTCEQCDERRPACGSCTARNVQCEFLNLAKAPPKDLVLRTDEHGRADATSTSAALSPSPARALTLPLYAGQDEGSRVFELRLYHQYVLNARAFRPYDAEDETAALALNPHPVMRRVPDLAMQGGYMMDALLGISAMTMYFRDSSNRQLKVATFKYMCQAISKLKAALRSGAKKQKPELLFSSCALVATHTLTQHLLDPDGKNQKDIPVVWLSAYRGLTCTGDWRPESVFGDDIAFSAPREASKFVELENRIQAYAHPGPFAFLLDGQDDQALTNTSAVYKDVVAYLSILYEAPTRSTVWWFLMSNRTAYISRANGGESRARLILAVYLIFMGVFNKNRLFGHCADQHTMLIEQELDREYLVLLNRARTMILKRSEEGWNRGA